MSEKAGFTRYRSSDLIRRERKYNKNRRRNDEQFEKKYHVCSDGCNYRSITYTVFMQHMQVISR